MPKNNLVLLRGGGDLATGVALRLHRAGIKIVITELAQPLAVRRTVSFAEAVYEGSHTVEGVKAKLIETNQLSAHPERRRRGKDADEIPVIVDPNADILLLDMFCAVVDARLVKLPPTPLPKDVPLHIGLGPGFHAGRNCHAVIETRRSHTLGRVYWDGTTQADTGEPEGDPRRVLRAPNDGIVIARANIGEHVEEGQVVADIHNDVILSEATLAPHTSAGENLQYNEQDSSPSAQSDIKVVSPFKGVLRGLIHDNLKVKSGMKIGDVDTRDDASACYLVSDKALAIGGGVLEAILSKKEIRDQLFAQ